MTIASNRSLTAYHRKRDFGQTAEPRGNTSPAPGQRYVMHKHAASNLHYDLRLEERGVLRSWALPKGPSLKRGEKRLAVEVEDHPIEYGEFEGTIPPGQYGGGTIMLWDAGSWVVNGKHDADRIDFMLDGSKLKGAWTLVRTGSGSGRPASNWLLIKRGSNDISAAQAHNRSIHSGRTMTEIARGADFDRAAIATLDDAPVMPANIPAARRQPLPKSFAPQLATLTGVAPDGDDWVHEIKFDGYRIIVRIDKGKVRLLSRNGLNWTGRFQAQAQQLAALTVEDAILDGEMVALGAGGKPSFGVLQDLIREKDTGSLVLQMFDLMYLDGYDLTAATLLDRKSTLRSLLHQSGLAGTGSKIQYSAHVTGHGREFFAEACKLGLEGTVAKRAESGYGNRRSKAWLKIKCSQDGEFVVGGFTRPSGSRKGFGALLLGSWEGSALCYRGRVGTGFSVKQLAHLHGVLSKARKPKSPFADPVPDTRGVTWVAPQLVVNVAFSERTREGRLRHATFRGVREDRNPRDIATPVAAARVSPAAASRAPARARGGDVVEGIRITHPERVVYPDTGLTKLDIARFYADIQDWLLPLLANRLLSLVRCPDGRQQECFFQKHLLASQARNVPRQDFRQSKGLKPYAYVQSIAHVIALVQSGVLEFHPFGSLITDLEHPDLMVFDLDPSPGVQWQDILGVTRGLRERLEKLGFHAFVRTTGGKGLHIVVPLRPTTDWDGVKAFAKAVSERHAADAPSRLTTKLPKAQRRGKIFIDYLRNGRGATAIACYSTRARPGAPVAVPVRWDELKASLRPDRYTVANLRRRLALLKNDPWGEFYDSQVAITPRMRKAVGL
ncbi:DNA ligase D [Haliea sp. E1-2-M8]|uniref:DNA ligase D n=1 Tax=Haliea sp. E1-2-M8 TaxID=3064706 RepID=UPI00271CF66D|nr:DNA ligase D [Haliea sp. E1-2-M8]MDO8863552.1 DNA ligase D [Haliea sp. E1-2-M8]